MGPAPRLGKITAIGPAAGQLRGPLRCFLQRGAPSWSSPRTWSWLAPKVPFQVSWAQEDSVRAPASHPTADLAGGSIKPEAPSQAEFGILAPALVPLAG